MADTVKLRSAKTEEAEANAAKGISASRKAAKAKTQKFTRRKSCCIKKVDELARLCNVDVALIIYNYKKGRYYTYRSTDRESWPPTMKDIVCCIQEDIKCDLTYA